MAKLPELREEAAQGNLDAIQKLMQRAVAPQQLTASVTLVDRHLEIRLWTPQQLDQKAAVTLICRELSTWKHPCFETVAIHGKTSHTNPPLWIHNLDLTAASDTHQAHLLLAAGALKRTTAPSSRQTASARWSNPQGPVQRLDQSALKAIAASLLLASLVSVSDQVNFLLQPLITLVHELGHTFFAWSFGYFAIPAFDFMFGGGVTLQSGERSMLLLAAIAIGLGYLFYRYRHNDLTSRVLLGFTLVYALCACTRIHELLMIFMGHGFELLFAGIFLYRALSGLGCRLPIERPLYGMLGFFILFSDLRFAAGLLTNPEARATYEAGKGGLLDNDFVVLASNYFSVDLSIVFLFFLFCCLLTPVLTYLLFRYQSSVWYCLSRLWLITNDRGRGRAEP